MHVSAPHSMPAAERPGGLSRLIAAAVVNQKFCSLLLHNPAAALAHGYGGEPFGLAPEEQSLVLSIRATSLADFAMQVASSRNATTRPAAPILGD